MTALTSRHIRFTLTRASVWIALLCCDTRAIAVTFLAVWVTIVTCSTFSTVGVVSVSRHAVSTVNSTNVRVTQTRPSISIAYFTCHSVKVAVTSHTFLTPVIWGSIGSCQTTTIVATISVLTCPQLVLYQTFFVSFTVPGTLVYILTYPVVPHCVTG